MIDGSVVTSLVIAKTKIAHLKKLTLPRLEMLGCLPCSRSLVFARDALQLHQDCVYCCWTDTMIALLWIRSHPSWWKTFVANRVAEIQSLTSTDNWFHCPGAENPADLLTRGLPAEELVNSNMWPHGSKLLLEDHAEFQYELCGEITASDPVEETSAHACISSEKPSVVFEVEIWVSLTKAIRVIAWVRRFLFNVRESRRIAKRVKKMCASCQQQDAAACSQPMAPLPPERANPAVPFAVTGLDHAGPLYCCDLPHKKFSVLLFTCDVVRAVDLELVESLSTPETILAIRRLSDGRGLSHPP